MRKPAVRTKPPLYELMTGVQGMGNAHMYNEVCKLNFYM